MKILVCLSAKEDSTDVVTSFACRLAEESASEVILLHVNPERWGHSRGYIEEREKQKMEDTLNSFPEHIRQFVEQPTRVMEEAGVRVRAMVLESASVPKCILEVGDREDVDLIVCGATIHGMVQKLFQPSVVSMLLNKSRRPILVVPYSDEG